MHPYPLIDKKYALYSDYISHLRSTAYGPLNAARATFSPLGICKLEGLIIGRSIQHS